MKEITFPIDKVSETRASWKVQAVRARPVTKLFCFAAKEDRDFFLIESSGYR